MKRSNGTPMEIFRLCPCQQFVLKKCHVKFRFQVGSYEGLREKFRIEPAIPELQDEWLNHCAMESSVQNIKQTFTWVKVPKSLLMKVHYPKIAQYSPYYLSLNVLLLPKDQTFIFYLLLLLFAGVVPCGGPRKSPCTPSIVQIMFLFRSFEINKDIQSVQNTHV